MKITLKVINNDSSEIETTAIIADFVAWERHTKRKASDLANGTGVEDLAYLAWASLKRTAQTALDFNTWLEAIAELEAVDEDPKSTPKGQ